MDRRRLALVFGNDSYKTSKLNSCWKDAKDMTVKLTELGFDCTQYLDQNLRQMKKAIDDFCATINDGDCVLIYFSGHGMEEKGQTYLIPIEDKDNPELNCICLDKLLKQLNNCKDKLLNIVILDAYRADKENNTWKTKATSAENEDDLKFAFDEVLSKNVRRTNDSQFIIIYSADPGTVSYAAGRHTNGNSYFTHSLLNHISTPNMKLQNIMIAVLDEIMLKSNNQRRPWIHSCLREHFFFKKERIQTTKNKSQQPGITVAGGNENGDKPNQLNGPQGIFIDNDKSIYIADCWNHRIVKWKLDSKKGQIIVGGNGKGNQDNQLYGPKDIIFDEENKSFIIADYGNKRVIRYFDNNQTKQQIIISNIDCCSLTIDKNGFIYVCDDKKHEVRRYKQGDTKGELVAGGNDKGSQLNQLHSPDDIFIDEYGSLYISDHCNQRVMKWTKDAKEGIVVAGGNGRGESLKHLSSPSGVVVDRSGQIYVADCGNDRIVRWCKEGKEGEIIAGGNGYGGQLNGPTGVSLDNDGNLYVVDRNNHRIQKFAIDLKFNLYEDLDKLTLHVSDYDTSTRCSQDSLLVKEQDQLTTKSNIGEADNSIEVESISAEEKSYYEECKQNYRITGMPLVSISAEVLNKTMELQPVLLKFVIDEDYNGFNVEEFLKNICVILNIDRNDITIAKIQKGSVVLEVRLSRENNNAQSETKCQASYHSLTVTNELRKEMGTLKVFFMLLGDSKPFKDIQKFRNEMKLHPQWIRTYGIGNTVWNGALDDGRDRGPHPYYCPVGWKRYALYVGDDYEDRFEGWSLCYHGTKFSHGLSILLSRLKPVTVIAHGAGIYTSPSIIYTSHPRYSEIKKIKFNEHTNFFVGGKYIQFILECRIRPRNIKKIGRQTLSVRNTTIDPNLNNDTIEWLINTEERSILDFNDPDATIVCTGVMIRVTDEHPGLLPESRWWYTSHLCNDTYCCALGIDITKLENKKMHGKQCNIILT